ncbi:Reticulon-domain-containing protein [Gamsiella multidivaricata]|uniref:Reticulon-domain-containing protein n=1 Tax=Gamsiella multidivaricata TaxID=101098 RepID=UPI00221EA4B2|nr:Reticulon-domain-containing protein [Gamsiella multidivaricata]KAG0366738.1 Reticulon-like protein [Gamsiella multidivaricata]KAI7820425.1 Reticulon-domain-containing protein [Gamsiella multidivaricata]
MDQDSASLGYLEVNHPSEHASVPASADPTPAPRERSSSDSPKASLEGKIGVTDHSAYMSPKLRSVLLWERPVISAAHLAGSLTLVFLCRWVSLLNLVSGLFVLGISGSFIYVNGLLAFNRVTNKSGGRPLEKYYSRSAEFVHVDTDTLHRRVDYVTDGLNVVLTELAKVVLIENNKRSLKYIGIFYAVWTLRTWFATTTLLAMILVSLFAVPRLYIDNQTLIDAQVAKANGLVQEHVEKGRQMAQEQWNKVEGFAKSKGLLKKSEIKTE